MRWEQLLVFVITQHISEGYKEHNTIPSWTPDFLQALLSMKGPEGDSLKLKFLRQITSLNDEMHLEDGLDCPDRLITVLEAFSCKNTTQSLKLPLDIHQLFTAAKFDPQMMLNILQENCSKLPSTRYSQICQLYLNRPSIVFGTSYSFGISKVKSGISKCYQEHKRTTNYEETNR